MDLPGVTGGSAVRETGSRDLRGAVRGASGDAQQAGTYIQFADLKNRIVLVRLKAQDQYRPAVMPVPHRLNVALMGIVGGPVEQRLGGNGQQAGMDLLELQRHDVGFLGNQPDAHVDGDDRALPTFPVAEPQADAVLFQGNARLAYSFR